MSDAKPLHVQVAEALGWTKTEQHECKPSRSFPTATCGWPDGAWTGVPPEPAYMKETDWQVLIRSYDTDWSATGPLIEKYGIGVWPSNESWIADTFQKKFPAIDGNTSYGSTPLDAICHLILALHKAGKL